MTPFIKYNISLSQGLPLPATPPFGTAMLRLGLPAALTESHPAAPGVTLPGYLPTLRLPLFAAPPAAPRTRTLATRSHLPASSAARLT